MRNGKEADFVRRRSGKRVRGGRMAAYGPGATNGIRGAPTRTILSEIQRQSNDIAQESALMACTTWPVMFLNGRGRNTHLILAIQPTRPDILPTRSMQRERFKGSRARFTWFCVEAPGKVTSTVPGLQPAIRHGRITRPTFSGSGHAEMLCIE